MSKSIWRRHLERLAAVFSGKLGRRRSSNIKLYQRKPAFRPLLEQLEDRLAPATLSDGGSNTLSIVLAANENLGIISSGASYTFFSNQNFSAASGVNPGNQANAFSSFGTSNLILTSAGIAQYTAGISITDGGAGASVTFYDSGSNAYANNFKIALAKAGAGVISFNGNSSFGNFNLQASTTSNMQVNSGAVLSSNNGNITLQANHSTVDTAGVLVYGASGLITSLGGNVQVTGQGGGSSATSGGGNDCGVAVYGGVITAGGNGSVTVQGTGGTITGSANGNCGVIVGNDGGNSSMITSGGGNVQVIGQGGGGAPYQNAGVEIGNGGQVTAGGNGNVTVQGTGGLTTAGGDFGVNLEGFGDNVTPNTIVNNAGPDPIVGTFNGLPEGAVLPNFSATISYIGGDGNDVVLTAIASTPMATTTVLTSSAGAITYGQLVTLKATVAPTAGGGGAPALGSVDFQDVSGNINLGVASTDTVSGSNAIFTLITTPTQLQVLQANGGIHAITATYSPGNGFMGSLGTLASGVKVTPAPLTVTAAGAPGWASASSMPSARQGPTATLLPSGQVLVTGGYNLGTSLSSAELYNPTSNTWTSAGSMASAREDQTATLLPNGQVLVTGGIDGLGHVVASAELYNPQTNTWSAAASMSAARAFHTATLLQNGQVLVAGGNNTPLASAELYNPTTNTWSPAGSMATARAYQTATLLADGRVLVTGGYGTTAILSSAEIYSPATNTWSSAGSMAQARWLHTATLLTNGQVLVTGGDNPSTGVDSSTAELYNPATNLWSSAASMASARENQTATLLTNGQVLVAGGFEYVPGVFTGYLSSAELYNPASNDWSSAGSMASARQAQAATLLQNGEVLVTGGNNTNSESNGALASAELFSLGSSSLANNKVYDATSAATLNTSGLALSGVYSPDMVSLGTSGARGAFTSLNVGTNIMVTTTGFTITGPQAGNYTLVQPTTTANITPATLTITATTSTKNYDAKTTSAAVPIVSGLQGSDTVTGLAEVYATASAGSGKTLGINTATTLSGALKGPQALAFDNSGNLFVANNANGTISKFAPGATIPSATLTGLTSPIALAFDVAGNLYVANFTGNTVSKFVPGAVSPSSTLTGLNGPRALAFDGSGDLYVSNGNGTTVSEFAPGATAPSATLTGLTKPAGLAFDGSGNLFVANFNSGSGTTISKFAPGATTSSASLTGLNGPNFLAFDGAGNLFASNGGNNTVSKFAPGATTPSATLTGLSTPYTLVFDSSGNLYVANTQGTTVTVFAPGATTPSAVLTGLSQAYGLAFDSSGNLFVSNYIGSTVSIFSPGATTASNTIPALSNPASLALNSSGNLYVANFANGTGTTISKFVAGATTPSATLTGVSGPLGMALDGSGDLFVANIAAGSGTTVSEFFPGATTPSATLTGVSGPYALAFDAGHNLYVSNAGTGAGTTISKFAPGATTPSATLTGLSGPVSMAFDAGGNLFVANFSNNTVSEFSPGATVASATLTGLNKPRSLVFDGNGNLYVANYGNNTVSEFPPGATTAALTLTGLNLPFALALDGSGNLYVVNNGGNTVSRFAPGATTAGTTFAGLNAPDALVLDANGNLYVANNGANTVSKFAPGAYSTGYTINDGNGGNNYVVTVVTNTTGVINKAPLTITALTNTRTYNSTTSAAAAPTVTGLLGSDTVTGLTEAYANANAGSGKTLSVSAYTIIDGNNGNNYTVTTVANQQGTIKTAALTITAVTNTKTYDSTTAAASTPTVAGLQGNDTLANLTEVFSSSKTGVGKILSVSAYTVNDGNSGSNYTVTTASNGTGVINRAALTITASTNTKAYDATTTAAAAPTVSGLFGNDTVTNGAESYDTPNLGSGKTLSVTSFTLNDGNSGNNYTVTTVANNTGVINPGPFSKYAITLPAGNTIVAGNPFIFTVQATDAFGDPVNSYAGPTSVTTNTSPNDSQSNFPLSSALQISNLGFGYFLGNLKTVGTYVLTVSAGTFSGTSTPLAVVAATADHFTLAAPAAATTGMPINVTVSAYDHYGNLATGYSGTVKLASTDAAAVLGNNYIFTTSGASPDNGAHTFSVILNTAGNQTVSVADASSTTPIIGGASGAIITRGLTVQAITPAPDGFTVSFSKPFMPGDLALYGAAPNAVADVVMKGSSNVGAIHGSLLIDPSDESFTFKATANYMALLNSLHGGNDSVILPDATYTVTLIAGSGANGFQDALGAGLDGANSGGHANFVTTFTTHYQANATPVLGIPDFARGPDSNTPILVPNNGAAGIPLTLYNAANVTDVTFSLTYNPALLNITGTVSGGNSDATDAAATFTLVANSGGVAAFHYHDTNAVSATAATPLVLGDISAVVPSGAAAAALGLYQTKEQLQPGMIVINQGAVAGAVAASGVHVNAYFGDVNGDKVIDGLDKLTANNAAVGAATGFSAYAQLDPAIIGDVAGDFSLDAGDVSTIDAFVAQLQPEQIPLPPTQLPPSNRNYVNPNNIHSPNAADPTLSLVASGPTSAGASSVIDVALMIDHPHPGGSTGLTEASLSLTYDPAMLSVAPADITLGSVPGGGVGWQLSSVVDQKSGQIGIELYSLAPITASQNGSLVNIAFHLTTGERRGVSPPWTPPTTVQLVDTATPNGQWFGTRVADAQGGMILGPGVDRLVVSAEVDAAGPLGGGDDDGGGATRPRRADAAPLAAAGGETVPVGIFYAPEQSPNPQAGQNFQIGNLPIFNLLLYLNSPGQLAVDSVFRGLADFADDLAGKDTMNVGGHENGDGDDSGSPDQAGGLDPQAGAGR